MSNNEVTIRETAIADGLAEYFKYCGDEFHISYGRIGFEMHVLGISESLDFVIERLESDLGETISHRDTLKAFNNFYQKYEFNEIAIGRHLCIEFDDDQKSKKIIGSRNCFQKSKARSEKHMHLARSM